MKARVIFHSSAGTHFPLRLDRFLNFVELSLLLPSEAPPSFDLYTDALEGLDTAPDPRSSFSDHLPRPPSHTKKSVETACSRFVVNISMRDQPETTTDMWQSVLDSFGEGYRKRHGAKDPFLVQLREGSWCLLHPDEFKRTFVHSDRSDPYWFFSAQNVPEFSFLPGGDISEQSLKVTLLRRTLLDKRNNT